MRSALNFTFREKHWVPVVKMSRSLSQTVKGVPHALQDRHLHDDTRLAVKLFQSFFDERQVPPKAYFG